MTVIPYTHWAYFPDQDSAQHCATDLADFVTRLREQEDGTWLLLAGRDVDTAELPERHGMVEAIVQRYGGAYDGGEVTYLHGKPVADPLITDEESDR
ncbi:hypothetical protein SAM9427_36845 (plasmid) [Streptomyces sp. ETH9427]|uniref:ribonuclease E inhibitor RraB n=1 Tax=Streptomyces sp. E1N211 TaxID=1851876 RepID=UPI000E0B6694|nr:ribonuclease E inhibitor RraB [Streptomyces sp. E1N211]AXI91337.1 hypothetical protein SAM9427_36845 [Streptomyces sp. ETH9427]